MGHVVDFATALPVTADAEAGAWDVHGATTVGGEGPTAPLSGAVGWSLQVHPYGSGYDVVIWGDEAAGPCRLTLSARWDPRASGAERARYEGALALLRALMTALTAAAA